MPEAIVLDNSINTRLLWPDTEVPENDRYAVKVIQQAGTGSVFHVPTIWHYEAAHVAATLYGRAKSRKRARLAISSKSHCCRS